MGDDALYARTSEYFVGSSESDEKQDKARKEQTADVMADYPVLREVIENLDASISHLKSLDALPAELQTKPEEMLHVIMANKKAAIILEVERAKLIDLVDAVAED